MIKYAAYLPTSLLEELNDLMDFHFLEPNTHPKYIGFYARQTDKPKLLDNGLIEFENSWGVEALVEYRQKVMADDVIGPDRLGNWYFNLMSFRTLLGRHPQPSIVLAGPDWQEQCNTILKFRGSTLVCLPYRLNRQPVEGNRIHLLGFKKPEYYTPYRAMSRELSLDTTEPISAGYHLWSYAKNGLATFPRPKDYADLYFTVDQITTIRSNILWFKNYLNTKD